MKKAPLIILAVLILGLAVLAIGTGGDEPLEPAAAKAAAFRPPSVAPIYNAYVGVCGLGRPMDGDVVRAGKKYLAEEAEPPGGPASGPGPHYSYLNPCLNKRLDNCLDQILAEAAVISAAYEKNADFVERYRAVKTMPSYVNTSGYNARDAHYRSLLSISKLVSDKAFLDIGQGDLRAGLEALEQEFDFFKMMARSEYIQLADLAAADMRLRDGLILLSRLIEDGRLDIAGEAERFRAMLELDIQVGRVVAAALEMEKRIMLQMLESLSGKEDSSAQEDDAKGFWPGTLQNNFFKINRTMNSFAALFDEEIRQIQATPLLNFPDSYRSVVAAQNLEARLKIKNLYETYGLFFFKNYFGEYLLSIGRPLGFQIAARVNDSLVYAHLARAQLELRLMADRPEDISEALAGLGPETWNPYTGRPFEWDKENNVLWAELAAAAEEAQVRVPPARE